MQYENFSSWPPEQERDFVVFEARTVEAGKKATVMGWGIAGALAFLILVVVLGFWGPIKQPGEVDKPTAAETAPAK